MTTRIGYIGLDHHHRDPYLESIDQLDGAVTCVCDPSGVQSLAGISTLPDDLPYYTDPTALLEEADVDLVWVTISNQETPGVINAALERDIDVFTEKPTARTAADLEPLVEAERAADATVCVSYTWRSHPIARKLRTLAKDEFFGDTRAFDTRFVASNLTARNTDHYLFDQTASRGGIVQWLGVHWLDLLPWILDDPILRVNAQTSTGTPGVDVEDGAVVQLETESGAIGSLTCGYYLREERYDTQVSIYGTEGQSEWDPIGTTFGFDGETTLELDDASPCSGGTPHQEVTFEYDSTLGYGGGWGLTFLKDALSATASTEDPPVGLTDAVTVLRVLDAVYESASTGKWTTVARD